MFIKFTEFFKKKFSLFNIMNLDVYIQCLSYFLIVLNFAIDLLIFNSLLSILIDVFINQHIPVHSNTFLK